MFNEHEINKILRAVSDKPDYTTSTGFTGNKKTKQDRENFKVGNKRRKTDHLTSKERKKLSFLHKQVDEVMVANSFIVPKSDNKTTKKDMKKGNNSNLGAQGIHGVNTFTKYKSVCKTFVKYCFENYKGIENIGDIKQGMFLDWVEHLAKDGKKNGEKYSVKTIKLYISSIQKLSESSTVAGKQYEKLSKLSEEKILNKVHQMKEKYNIRYSKSDYKRGRIRTTKDGKVIKGYTYEEARKITKKAYDMSPFYGVLYDVLTHSAPRVDELLKVKWRQVDTVNNRIYLDDKNQNKGNRPRFVPIPTKTAQKLQALKDLGLSQNEDSRIWGSRISKDDLYNLTKELCKRSHTGYGGLHDFRSASVEYHNKQITKALNKGKITREDLEKRFISHVSLDPRLNPIEVKMEKERDQNGNIIYKPLTDSKGNVRVYSNGRPRMAANWIPKTDEQGNFVKDHRYTLEEVKEWRTDKLINSLTSQLLGHNRSDASSPYKNG